MSEQFPIHTYEGFVKNSKRWVIFPRLSYLNHAMIEKRNPQIGEDFSSYAPNHFTGSGNKAVFASGVSYAYAKEYLQAYPDIRLCQIATPYPFPEKLVLDCLEGVEKAICIEELSPYLETQLLQLCGVGGQGTVLASKLIASAATACGETVHSAETIGMAQRGGSVTSHVRIGEDAFSPLIPGGSADLILAFEPAEAVRNLSYLKTDGTVLVNRIPEKPTSESLNETGYDGTEMLAYLHDKCRCLVIDVCPDQTTHLD